METAELIVGPEAPDVTIIAVPQEFTIYYSPARGRRIQPSWWRGSYHGRGVFVRHAGYFAGSKSAFSRRFLAIAEQADGLRQSLEDQSRRVAAIDGRIQPCWRIAVAWTSTDACRQAPMVRPATTILLPMVL